MQRPLTVNHLARHAGMPVRSFTRQFQDEAGLSPMRWLTGQRVLEAQRLLEATRLGIDEIAELCGFGSAATLRVHFAREVGSTPTAYRHARRPAAG
jgi:transcriptional regulator GlxA family with amidase domain